MLIHAGEFDMGNDAGEEGIEESLFAACGSTRSSWTATKLREESFQALVGRNPAKFSGPDRPVERVSWVWAVRYCNLRSLKEGLKPCYDRATLACDYWPTAIGCRRKRSGNTHAAPGTEQPVSVSVKIPENCRSTGG